MIALLTGKPLFFGTHLVLDVRGVGYGVGVNAKNADAIRTQETTTLHIYSHIREDTFELFGFLSREELGLFEELLAVSGVGPKTALAITSAQPAQIAKAVREGNVQFFSEFPRVGKKLAQKIIIELKSKLGSIEDLMLGEPTTQTAAELEQALIFLGYPENQVRSICRRPELEGLQIQDAIKTAVKLLAQREATGHV